MFKALSYTSLMATVLLSSTVMAANSNTTVAGSTSVSTLLEPFIEQYNHSSEHNIDLQSIDSSAGIVMLNTGAVDLAISSRQLSDTEKETLSSKLIAYDAIAVVVHPENPIKNLTAENIWKIYHGDISNWKEVGGEDKKIAVVTRELASGSRFSFENNLGLTKEINSFTVSDISKNAIVVNGTSMVKSIVAHNPHAIGYTSAGSIGDLAQLHIVTIDNILPTAQAIIDNKYPLSRPFLFVFKNDELSTQSNEFISYMNSDSSIQKIQSLGYVK
jgi:phosphate transport system substrate-binding protein